MATAYIIQSAQNPNFCIGVTQASAGSLVVLSTLQGAGNTLTQWLLDPNTGHMQLAANPDLYLDWQGTSPSGSQLIVTDYVLGRTSQTWNWVGNPPYISNNAAFNYVIDNSGAQVTAGNPILLWPQNSAINQKWNRLAVPRLSALGVEA